mgnify:CR=1 FL=1
MTCGIEAAVVRRLREAVTDVCERSRHADLSGRTDAVADVAAAVDFGRAVEAPTDVVGAGTTVQTNGTLATALMRRDCVTGRRRRADLVGRHEQEPRRGLPLDRRDALDELVTNALRDVGLGRALHLVDEEIVLDVGADRALARLLVVRRAEHDGLGADRTATLHRQDRILERHERQNVARVGRHLQRAACERDLVADGVVVDRALREHGLGREADEDCDDERRDEVSSLHERSSPTTLVSVRGFLPTDSLCSRHMIPPHEKS